MRIKHFILMTAMMAVTAFCFIPVVAQEENSDSKPDCFASVNGIVGTCEVLPAGADDSAWAKAELNQCLNVGDKVRTAGDGKAAVKYGDSLQMRLNASTTVVISKQESSENPDQIELNEGELFSELDKEKSPDAEFKVVTPSGVMAVRGTKFNVAIDAEGKVKVNVLEGVLSVFNDLGEVLAEAGKATELLKGQLPLDPFEFNMEEFEKTLNEWKDAISIGKVLEAAKQQVEEKVNEVKDAVSPSKLKKKLGF